MSNSVLLPLFAPFICAILGLIPKSLRLQQALGLLGSALATVFSFWLLLQTREHGYVVLHLGEWQAPFGITLVADILGALMVLISSLTTFFVVLFAIRDLDRHRQRLHFYPLLNFLLMGINGAFLTGDVFNLYVWFEVILIASFILLALGGDKPQLEGAFKYVAINLVASSLFLAGAGLLYAKVGTLNMADVAMKLSDQPDSILINSTAVLFLIAFGIKAALFPFFFWLPASYHTPPPAISALFAGLLTKVGIYAILRAYTLFFAEGFAFTQDLLFVIASITMVTGVLGAAAQYNIRKILTFHVVSQIGYLLLGIALLTPLAIAATIFYTLHIIIVKTNLLLISGIIERLRGTAELSRLGGLYKHMPWLSIIFLISALSLAGIPPLSGFWAKFSLIQAGLEAEAYVATIIALVVGVLTLFSMTKIWAEAFWKKEPDDAPQPVAPTPEAAKAARQLFLPVGAMLALTLYLGLFGNTTFEIAQEAAEQLSNPITYIEAVSPQAFQLAAQKPE